MKTIIAAFCDAATAQQAIQYLNTKGVRDAQLMGYEAGSSMSLSRFGAYNIPDDRAQLYAEVLRRGASVVVAHVEHDARDLARDLDNMGSIDLDAAAKRWKKSGWNGYDMNALPFDATACATERTALRDESTFIGDGRNDYVAGANLAGQDLDVIEERVDVGKREVDRGGVRVRTVITERPVEEQVELTEERIDVRRDRVDEPISPAAADAALTEDEFVVTARGEEAVIGKEARVVERVHVGKESEQRTETARETERRRDVQVEPITARTEVDERRRR